MKVASHMADVLCVLRMTAPVSVPWACGSHGIPALAAGSDGHPVCLARRSLPAAAGARPRREHSAALRAPQARDAAPARRSPSGHLHSGRSPHGPAAQEVRCQRLILYKCKRVPPFVASGVSKVCAVHCRVRSPYTSWLRKHCLTCLQQAMMPSLHDVPSAGIWRRWT